MIGSPPSTSVPTSETLTRKPFTYSGSLATGLTVRFGNSGTAMTIPVRIIDIIRAEITRRSPVLMGANRDPLVPNSVGDWGARWRSRAETCTGRSLRGRGSFPRVLATSRTFLLPASTRRQEEFEVQFERVRSRSYGWSSAQCLDHVHWICQTRPRVSCKRL
jgi:hypothetical protein